MKSQSNICKFIANTNNERLYTSNFVLEKEQKQNKERILNDHVAYLVLSGKGLLRTQAVTGMLMPGTVFFTFTGVPFRIENLEGLEYMYISFGGGRSDELFSRFGIHPARCVFEGYESLLALWQNVLMKADADNLDLLSESVLLYTFSEMLPARQTVVQGVFSSILKYIDEHYMDNELNLASVSQQLGYNPKYISRVFKSHMGISFSAYLTNVRIQNAVFLMEQGVTAIKNVSLLSGYKDPLYFSSVFKKHTGKSPREFMDRKNKKC